MSLLRPEALKDLMSLICDKNKLNIAQYIENLWHHCYETLLLSENAILGRNKTSKTRAFCIEIFIIFTERLAQDLWRI